MRWLGREGGLSLGDAWREMERLAGHWTLKGFGHWVLDLRVSEELVGRAGLLRPPERPGLQLGWTVAQVRGHDLRMYGIDL
jgi:RimJ/RimL family protein N-acetyltransferase